MKDRIARRGETVIPDRVVSELTLGFWVTILSRPYDARLWSAQGGARLSTAFMRLPRRQRQRQRIHQHYNEIRELRNRVFHHEPLFDDPRLRQRHDELKLGLHWLNPRMVDWLEDEDRFPDVYRDGRALVEQRLRRHVGLL